MSASSSKEHLRKCFICHIVINGAAGVFEYHLNQCQCCASTLHKKPRGLARTSTPNLEDKIDEINDDDHVSPPRAAIEVLFISDSEDEDVKDDDDVCPICDLPWRSIDVGPVQGSRDAHVGECLEHSPLSAEASEMEEGKEGEEDGLAVIAAKISSSARRKEFGSFKKPRHFKEGRNTEPEGTSGLVAVIASIAKMAPRKLSPVWTTLVANQHTQHIRGRSMDLVWRCGYRNAQMLYSSLRHLPEYNSSASGPSPVPSILELQGVIEDAWKAGHDLNGAAHSHRKLRGSKRWTGAIDMYTAESMYTVRLDSSYTVPIRPGSSQFSTFVLHNRCQVVDFPKLPHANLKGAKSPLIRWIVAYFTGTLEAHCVSVSNSNGDIRLRESSSFPASISPVMSAKPPLCLQHQGYSRTVVGIEYDEQGEGYLLVFDPARRIPKAVKKAASKLHDAMSSLSASPPRSKKRRRSSTPSTSASVKAFWGESPQARLKPDPNDAKALLETSLFTAVMADAAMMSLPSTGLDVKSLSTFRVGFKSLSCKDQYQVVYVEPGSRLSAEEVETRKIVKSQRVIG